MLSLLRELRSNARRPPRPRAARRVCLSVERLEDRLVPAVFLVENLNDSGAGSLRQALLNANATAGADIIRFADGLTGAITLTSGQLGISDSVSIIGPGADVLTISANDNSRIFVDTSSGSTTVSITGLTLTSGRGNSAAGGAIFINNDTWTVSNMVFEGNSSTSTGGAIHNSGTLTVLNSTFHGNTASGGGGIYNGSGATLTIHNSTFSNNTAVNNGGGVFNSGGTVTIRQSTFSNNMANSGSSGGGGGIITSGLGLVTIQNSTFTANTAANNGGGIFVNSGTLTLESTIVANNTATNGADVFRLSGTLNARHSLIRAMNDGALNGDDPRNNIFGEDPLLAPLGYYGGPTQTHALLVGSPALDAGFNYAGTTTDQRGDSFPRQIGTAVDIGAYEGASFIVINTNDSGAGSLRDVIDQANNTTGFQYVLFASNLMDRTITLTSGEIAIADSVHV
ncbi:MAG: choice-of-anchor Q domain-containing protein, partial [Gemmataceae bacterium]